MLGPRDLPLLPVFVAVATTGSFTAAGRELQLNKSVVSEHVRTLEERIGVRLLERTTRRLHVTQIGELVLEAARGIMDAVRSLESVVESRRVEPTGTLRIAAPATTIATAVSTLAATLIRTYPKLRVELLLDDTLRDLVADRLDVAVRVGVVVNSSYIAHRLGTESEIIVASVALIDQHGDIKHPRALQGAPWVSHARLGKSSLRTFRTETGRTQNVSVDNRAVTDSALSVRALVLGGAGFGVLPSHMVAEDLRAGRLVRVCPTWTGRQVSLHALVPARHPPPRVQVFLDGLVGALAPLGFSPKL